MRFVVKTYGFKTYEKKFFQVGQNVERPHRALNEAAGLLMHITEQTFQSQGRRGGGSWRKISAAWRERKVRKGLDPRILHMTLRLRHSLTKREHPELHITTTRNSLVYGTNVPYAGRQNEVRPFMKITRGDRRELAKVIVSDFVSPFNYGRRRYR